ncbi:MAG: hypothetical protein V7609_2150 [Verrucomicrobiota bacterium]
MRLRGFSFSAPVVTDMGKACFHDQAMALRLLKPNAQSPSSFLLWCRGQQTNNKQRKKINQMKNSILNIALLALLGGSFAVPAFAGASAQQTVTYEVQAINELAVSEATASLTVNAAIAGSAPTSANDSTTSYAITTNEAGRKITGSINTAMPSGVALSVNLAAPSGATSAGPVALSTTAQDLVTGISTLNESGKSISYSLSATAAAGVVPSASKTVTLTITAEV